MPREEEYLLLGIDWASYIMKKIFPVIPWFIFSLFSNVTLSTVSKAPYSKINLAKKKYFPVSHTNKQTSLAHGLLQVSLASDVLHPSLRSTLTCLKGNYLKKTATLLLSAAVLIQCYGVWNFKTRVTWQQEIERLTCFSLSKRVSF